MAGGNCVYVPLRVNPQTSVWELSFDELEKAISEKTKLIIINTPHNPTGKVFSLSELEEIAAILRRNPHVTAVTDEVYEHMIYDGKQHLRLASLPDMWARTITISSCGKTFSCTGWKTGWAYGHADLIKPIMLANQWVQFSVPTPNQRAIADVIEQASKPYQGYASYYAYLTAMYQLKRDHLVASLRAAHLHPYVPEGGFFIIADTSAHHPDKAYEDIPGPTGESPVTRDWAFAR